MPGCQISSDLGFQPEVSPGKTGLNSAPDSSPATLFRHYFAKKRPINFTKNQILPPFGINPHKY